MEISSRSQLPHYDVRSTVGELEKIKVKAKLTLPSTFVVEGAQTVEDEEYEEIPSRRNGSSQQRQSI